MRAGPIKIRFCTTLLLISLAQRTWSCFTPCSSIYSSCLHCLYHGGALLGRLGSARGRTRWHSPDTCSARGACCPQRCGTLVIIPSCTPSGCRRTNVGCTWPLFAACRPPLGRCLVNSGAMHCVAPPFRWAAIALCAAAMMHRLYDACQKNILHTCFGGHSVARRSCCHNGRHAARCCPIPTHHRAVMHRSGSYDSSFPSTVFLLLEDAV